MEIRILVVGDIVGSPGRAVFKEAVGVLKKDGLVDFVIANAENAAGGRGLTIALARELFEAGADVLTMGDHVWDQKESIPYFDREPRIVRALNLPPGCRFHTRCPFAKDICRTHDPELQDMGQGRAVACHFPLNS